MKTKIFLFVFLGLLNACNPFGNGDVSVSKDYQPGKPDRDLVESTDIELDAATLSFVSADQVQRSTSDSNAPKIIMLSGLSTGFNARLDLESPEGLTRSEDSNLALGKDNDSDCDVSCSVKNMYMGILTYVYGE